MVKLIFAIGAAVCFALDAFNVPATVKWTPLGFCLLTIGFLVL